MAEEAQKHLQEAGDKIKSGWSSFADFMGDVWTEITSTEVPTLENKNWGIGVFITNIFLPGVGTFVSGLKAERNTTMVLLESETEPILEPEPAPEPEPEPEPDQVVGVLQFLTAWIIVGWIWSIYWGWLLYSKAGEGWHSLLPGK